MWLRKLRLIGSQLRKPKQKGKQLKLKQRVKPLQLKPRQIDRQLLKLNNKKKRDSWQRGERKKRPSESETRKRPSVKPMMQSELKMKGRLSESLKYRRRDRKRSRLTTERRC